MEWILAVILGGAFGAALYVIGLTYPSKVLAMLRLQDLLIVKIILFAIGVSSILLVTGIGVGFFPLTHLSIREINLGVLVGGLIFGLGFGWIGMTPATAIATVGTPGVKKAIVTIIGGLIGAFIYTMTSSFWENIRLFTTMEEGQLTLFELSEQYPSVLSVGYAGLFVTGLVCILAACVIPKRMEREN